MRNLLLLLILCLGHASVARAEAPPQNTVLMGADLLGRSITASFDVEYFVHSQWSLGAAIGFVPLLIEDDSSGLAHFHLGYMPSKNGSIYLSLGTASSFGGEYDDDSLFGNTIFNLTIGYLDFTPGFFLRPTLSLHISGERALVLPGVTLGGSL